MAPNSWKIKRPLLFEIHAIFGSACHAKKKVTDLVTKNSWVHFMEAFVGEPENISQLVEEYAGGTDIQVSKVKYLSETYQSIQRVKRDGNCFIRAFLFGLFKHFETDDSKKVDVIEFIKASKDQLVSEGFSEFIEDFWEVLVEELEKSPISADSVNQSSTSDYLVCYLRFLMSAFLKRNESEYMFFLSDGSQNMQEFCMKEVEPMGVECDQLQIIALANSFAKYLNCGVLIEYLDNSDSIETNHVVFPEGTKEFVHLLYRPGHYDILIR